MDLVTTVKNCLCTMTREFDCEAGFINMRVGLALQVRSDLSLLGKDTVRYRKLEDTLCQTTIASKEAAVAIEDASKDERFRELEYVKSGRVVGYLGVPLRLDGEAIGTICAITRSPRFWTTLEREYVRSVARMIEAELRVEMQEIALEHFAKSLDDMDGVLAVLAAGIAGHVAIFDENGSPVFFTESIHDALAPKKLAVLGGEVVAAYAKLVDNEELSDGEHLEYRCCGCEMAVVKVSGKYFYCSLVKRLTLVH